MYYDLYPFLQMLKANTAYSIKNPLQRTSEPGDFIYISNPHINYILFSEPQNFIFFTSYLNILHARYVCLISVKTMRTTQCMRNVPNFSFRLKFLTLLVSEIHGVNNISKNSTDISTDWIELMIPMLYRLLRKYDKSQFTIGCIISYFSSTL